MNAYDYLIVGSGFAGSVCARQLADRGASILLIDKRDHIGGNAFDTHDSGGVLIHPYGPHIFHTNSKKIFSYLSKYTDWRFYEHRVLANIKNNFFPIPINRTTINKVFNKNLDEDSVEQFLETIRVKINPVKNSEDLVLSSVGEKLCDLFFRGYTYKQWGINLSELSASVAARIPTRTNDDDRYFADTFQFMPAEGYTKLFEKLLNSHLITVLTGVDFNHIKTTINYKKLIFTGPIDSFYDFRFGRLPYRSLSFVHTHLPDTEKAQSVGTINFPSLEEKYTRITEFKHLTGQKIKGTSVVREFSQSEGDPYYPIPNSRNEELFKKYKDLAELEKDVYFVGRLAEYRYYNMDQVVGAALSLCEKITTN